MTIPYLMRSSSLQGENYKTSFITKIGTPPVEHSECVMAKLVPQFDLSKRKPEELHRMVKSARVNHPVLDNREALAQRARLFQAVGHEIRLMILGLLELEELCFCNIIEALELPASTVAHHLSMLEDAGLVVRRENGKFTSFTLRKDLIMRHRILQ